MANIKIYNLRPAGLEPFSDSESYTKEMTEGELSGVFGGDIPPCNVVDGITTAGLGAGLGSPAGLPGAAIGGVFGTVGYLGACFFF